MRAASAPSPGEPDVPGIVGRWRRWDGPARTEADDARVSDVKLVARCRAGDQSAWETLVDRYSTYVHSIVMRQFRLSPADAEDVFQETFARLYLRIDRLRDAIALQAWIGRTTRNLAVDRIRAGRRLFALERADGTTIDVAGTDEYANIDQAMDLRRALDDLGEPCRDLLRRFFLDDQSYAVISAALGIPSGTVASRISRCLQRLQPAMEPWRRPGQAR